jgi:hypothetical protein
MNSQKFSFGQPPWQGGCVFENQFSLSLAHRVHPDFQNLINIPKLRQYGEALYLPPFSHLFDFQ